MRSAFVSHEHRLIIYWSPKCACTSLAHWMACGLLGMRDLRPGEVMGWLVSNGYAVRGREFAEAPPAYHSVAFTREPFSRAVSAYANKFVVKGNALRELGSPKPSDFLQRFAFKLHQEIARESSSGQTSVNGISFLQFLGHINRKTATRGTREPVLNRHWNTQVSFWWVRQGRGVEETYDIGQFDHGIRALNERFGIEYWPRKANPTRYSDSGQFVGDIGAFELARLGITPSSAQLASPLTIELASLAYGNDYDWLGYRPPEMTTNQRNTDGAINHREPAACHVLNSD